MHLFNHRKLFMGYIEKLSQAFPQIWNVARIPYQAHFASLYGMSGHVYLPYFGWLLNCSPGITDYCLPRYSLDHNIQYYTPKQSWDISWHLQNGSPNAQSSPTPHSLPHPLKLYPSLAEEDHRSLGFRKQTFFFLLKSRSKLKLWASKSWVFNIIFLNNRKLYSTTGSGYFPILSITT